MPNREQINSTISRLLTPTILGGLVPATLTTALAGANNDLVFTAKVGGAGGNAITVAYVNPGDNDQALAVTVAELAISVSLATGPAGAITSTANDILAAINADAAAKMLVTASLPPAAVGTGVVIALAATNLAGGDATVVTSAALDTLEHDSASFNLHIGATLAAGMTFKVTECDTVGGVYTDAPATSVVGAAGVPAANTTLRVAYIGNKQFCKLVVTPGGASDLSISGSLGYPKVAPTTNPA
jgi:hypothetical protein